MRRCVSWYVPTIMETTTAAMTAEKRWLEFAGAVRGLEVVSVFVFVWGCFPSLLPLPLPLSFSSAH